MKTRYKVGYKEETSVNPSRGLFFISEDVMKFLDNYNYFHFHESFGQDVDHFLNVYKSRRFFEYSNIPRNDLDFLKSDWIKVGNDIKTSMQDFSKDYPKVSDGRRKRAAAT